MLHDFFVNEQLKVKAHHYFIWWLLRGLPFKFGEKLRNYLAFQNIRHGNARDTILHVFKEHLTSPKVICSEPGFSAHQTLHSAMRIVDHVKFSLTFGERWTTLSYVALSWYLIIRHFWVNLFIENFLSIYRKHARILRRIGSSL